MTLDLLLLVACCLCAVLVLARGLSSTPATTPTAVETPRHGVYQGLLERAGWRNGTRRTFVTIKLLALLTGGIAMATTLRDRPLGIAALDQALAVALFLAGALGPELGLYLQGRARLAAIERDLPFVFDLLVAMLDAGLNLQQAVERVAAEGKEAGPATPLERDLAQIGRELRAGLDPDRAFAGFLRRTPLPEVQAVVSTLTQGGQRGVEVLGGLQEQADQLRARLHERALRNAEQLQTTLVYPVTLCFLPAAMLLAAGPLFLQLMEMLSW